MKQGFCGPLRVSGRNRTTRAFALLGLLAAAIAAPLSAQQIYSWTDENGVTHFSETPRAAGDERVIEVEEAYRPGSVELAPPPAAEDGEAGEAPPSPAEARRTQLREHSQSRREQRAEQERLCTLHRQRLEQMEPARRVLYVDENGDTVRMDDDQRLGLIEESKGFLEANCAD